MAKLQSISNAS